MFAIVSVLMGSRSQNVQLLGYGNTERAARRAAFSRVNGGMNPYDDEYHGGTLVKACAALVDMIRAGERYDAIYENEKLVGYSCTDAYHDMCGALANLYIDGDTLRTRAR